MPKLIALDLAIKLNALTKFESETGKISKLELRKLVASLDYKHPDLR